MLSVLALCNQPAHRSSTQFGGKCQHSRVFWEQFSFLLFYKGLGNLFHLVYKLTLYKLIYIYMYIYDFRNNFLLIQNTGKMYYLIAVFVFFFLFPNSDSFLKISLFLDNQ